MCGAGWSCVPDLVRRAGDMQAEMPFGCVEMTVELLRREAGESQGNMDFRTSRCQDRQGKWPRKGLSCPSDCGGGITRKIENPVPLSQPEVLIL